MKAIPYPLFHECLLYGESIEVCERDIDCQNCEYYVPLNSDNGETCDCNCDFETDEEDEYADEYADEVSTQPADAEPTETKRCEECQGYLFVEGQRYCTSTWGRCAFEADFRTGEHKHLNTVPIDTSTVSCGGFRKLNK